MTNFDTLQETLRWFEEAVPSPTSKNRHTQLGVHFEEVGEMLESLETKDPETLTILMRAEVSIKALAKHLKTHHDVISADNTKLLDALCDQIVTAIGVGHMESYDIAAAMDEVNASNWSKFVNGKPVFNENQKIIKGPEYFKADLSHFLP